MALMRATWASVGFTRQAVRRCTPWLKVWTALLLTVVRSPVAAAENQYALVDLGTLGANEVNSKGLNAAGQVAGFVESGIVVKEHAFLYSDGAIHDLHAAVSKAKHCRLMRTEGRFVTDSGEVVGWIWCSGREVRRGWPGNSFVYRNGTAVVVAGLAGRSRRAGEFPVSTEDGRRVDVFKVDDQGLPRDAGRLEGVSGFATDMSASGQVIGWSVMPGSGASRAWLWSDAKLRELGTFGGPSSRAFAINACGDVVGAAETGNGERHAFLFRSGSMRDLGTLGGKTSIARDINTRGQIVGESAAEPTTAGGQSSEIHAFLYEGGEMKDLNRHLAGPAAQFVTLWEASGINDAGVITANGRDSRYTGAFGRTRAYLLAPVPKSP